MYGVAYEMIYFASHLLPTAEPIRAGGGISVERGTIVRVLTSHRAVQRARRTSGERVHDLGDGVLAPGLVNAHAHLELSGLADALDGRRGFVPWVRDIIRLRARLGAGDLERAVLAGARRLLATGTTTVGDIDASGAGPVARRAGLRTVVHRELLDAWDASRTASALARLRRRLPERALLREGVSPHAPYTTSDELLHGVARLLRRRPMPVAVHWSETREEGEWLEQGRGPFGELLAVSPRRSGLALLDEAGLLGPTTTLIHGNHPRRSEIGRMAAAGSSLVHCPGTHAFFGRPPFPWRRYVDAGVRLALGTDSLASNEDLDMRREMALALSTLPGLSPARAWSMATTDGAQALGLGGRVGELRAGAAADFVLYRPDAGGHELTLESLATGAGAVAAVWVAGRSVPPPLSRPAYPGRPVRRDSRAAIRIRRSLP